MSMSHEINTSSQDKVKKVLQSLQAARMLQRDRLMFGVGRVNRYVEDVDGDWLEKWGEDEAEPATAIDQ